jgi:hypothetical protein
MISEQAQKFSSVMPSDDMDLGEDNFLDSPLDKVEPYGLLKATMMSEWRDLPVHVKGE